MPVSIYLVEFLVFCHACDGLIIHIGEVRRVACPQNEWPLSLGLSYRLHKKKPSWVEQLTLHVIWLWLQWYQMPHTLWKSGLSFHMDYTLELWAKTKLFLSGYFVTTSEEWLRLWARDIDPDDWLIGTLGQRVNMQGEQEMNLRGQDIKNVIYSVKQRWCLYSKD